MCVIYSLLPVLLATISTAFCLLESIPAHVDGVLTAYLGDQISLTCSHNNPDTAVTKWLFAPPVNCTKAIDHHPPITTSACGPFIFVGISELSCCHLNSTAVATATISMTGTVVECRDSAGTSFNVIGRVSLCIIDLPQPPSNISWYVETASIMWNPGFQAACSRKDLSYIVTVIPLQVDTYSLFSTEVNIVSIPSTKFNTTYLVLVSTEIKTDQLQSETVSTLIFTTPSGDIDTNTSHNLTTSMEPGKMHQDSSLPSNMPCSCHDLVTNSSCITPESTGRIDLLVAVSVPVAVFLTLCIGLIVGSLFTYCFMKISVSQTLEYNSSIPQRPIIYEEILSPSSGINSAVIELKENAAYGPAGLTNNSR